jgi:hypothetical protein
MFMIDHIAQLEFLRATTVEIEPAPIDRLLSRVLPLVCPWLDHGEPIIVNFAIFVHRTVRGCILDVGPEAIALRDAIDEWMDHYRFTDKWIWDAAATTLLLHAVERIQPREWCARQTELHLLSVKVPYQENESEDQYRERFDQEYRRQRNEHVKRFRSPNSDYAERARWTAAAFRGETFASIARRGNVQIGEDAVRKAVLAFASRAGLTFPTLVETLTAHREKAG